MKSQLTFDINLPIQEQPLQNEFLDKLILENQSEFNDALKNREQIQIPEFTQFQIRQKQEPPCQLPTSYVRLTCVYPGENDYELQIDDLEYLHEYNQKHVIQLTEQKLQEMIQYLELQSSLAQFGTDPCRNYCQQQDLLDRLPYNTNTMNPDVLAYWADKKERIKRPLIRVFMRALENDYRLNMAFRPSRPYKQKRQKRFFSNYEDYLLWNNIMKIENSVGLMSLELIRKREFIKKELIEVEKSSWQIQMEQEIEELECLGTPIKLIKQESVLPDELKQLKEIKKVYFQKDEFIESQKVIRDIPKPRPDYEKYMECKVQDCQFNLMKNIPSNILQEDLIEAMDEQFSRLKGRLPIWPKQPTIIRENPTGDCLVVGNQNRIGIVQQGSQILAGDKERHIVISKRGKKRTKIMMVDPVTKRASIVDGLRADFAHFVSHGRKWIEDSEKYIKEIQRLRLEKLKRQQLFQMRLQKEEQKKNSLKIKLKLDQSIQKIVLLDTKIVLRKAESGHFSVF